MNYLVDHERLALSTRTNAASSQFLKRPRTENATSDASFLILDLVTLKPYVVWVIPDAHHWGRGSS